MPGAALMFIISTDTSGPSVLSQCHEEPGDLVCPMDRAARAVTSA